jgi:hypothetical protein
MTMYFFEIVGNTQFEAEIREIHRLFPTEEKAISYLEMINTTVKNILYKSRPDALPQVHSVTWVFSDFEGIAYTTGSDTTKEICFSLRYVRDLLKTKHSLDLSELYGVMIHEATHVWQQSNGIPAGVCEGIADVVRYKAGGCEGWFGKANLLQQWDSGYRDTAFFLLWIESTTKIPNFIPNLNGNLKYRYWDGRMVEEMVGVSIQELWRQYQEQKLEKMVITDPCHLKVGECTIKSKSSHCFLAPREEGVVCQESAYIWSLNSYKNGYLIQDPTSQRVLDVYCYSTRNGDKIVPWPQNGGTNQVWKIFKPSRFEQNPPIKENEYVIVSEHSAKALELSPTNFVVQFDLHAGDNQIWIVESPREN